MRPELRERIIAYNKAVKEKSEKASDLDILMGQFAKLLSVSQFKLLLTDELRTILKKYGLMEE